MEISNTIEEAELDWRQIKCIETLTDSEFPPFNIYLIEQIRPDGKVICRWYTPIAEEQLEELTKKDLYGCYHKIKLVKKEVDMLTK